MACLFDIFRIPARAVVTGENYDGILQLSAFPERLPYLTHNVVDHTNEITVNSCSRLTFKLRRG